MVNTNRYPGLARGPIDHRASSVVNMVSDSAIDMGSVVRFGNSSTILSETLQRVEEGSSQGIFKIYGIAVGGDADGIYGDGSTSTDNSTRATTGAGQGTVVVTQGRCLARVFGGAGGVSIGESLTQSLVTGVLELGLTGDTIIAIALNDVLANDTDMIAVDVQREGELV